MVVTPSPNTAKQHIAFMDGLRGIAVLMVVLYHLKEARSTDFGLYWHGHGLSMNSFVTSGFMGVEIFFFISGFVLFYPYARHLFEGKPLQTLAQFVNKRALKILPSYVFSLVFMTALLVFWGDRSLALLQNFLAHLVFAHSVHRETFFGINGPLWSLAVEVQFYVIFPLLCWAFRRSPIVTPLLMITIAVGYRDHLRLHGGSGDSFYVYQLPGFLDVFALGMLSSYLIVLFRSRYPQLIRFAPGFTVLSPLAAIALNAMLTNLVNTGSGPAAWEWQNTYRTAFAAVLAVFAIAGMLAVPAWQRVIANPVFVFSAFISYNLYLWNKLVIVSLGPWLASLPPLAFSPLISIWVPLAGAAAIAIGTTYLVERPFLDHGWSAVPQAVTRIRASLVALKRPRTAKAPP